MTTPGRSRKTWRAFAASAASHGQDGRSVHREPQGRPDGLRQRGAGRRRHRAPGVPRRRAEHRASLRPRGLARASGRDDVSVTVHRRAGQQVLPRPEDGGGSRGASPRAPALGRRHVRAHGPLPDHVPGFITGFAMRPDLFARQGQRFADKSCATTRGSARPTSMPLTSLPRLTSTAPSPHTSRKTRSSTRAWSRSAATASWSAAPRCSAPAAPSRTRCS